MGTVKEDHSSVPVITSKIIVPTKLNKILNLQELDYKYKKFKEKFSISKYKEVLEQTQDFLYLMVSKLDLREQNLVTKDFSLKNLQRNNKKTQEKDYRPKALGNRTKNMTKKDKSSK